MKRLIFASVAVLAVLVACSQEVSAAPQRFSQRSVSFQRTTVRGGASRAFVPVRSFGVGFSTGVSRSFSRQRFVAAPVYAAPVFAAPIYQQQFIQQAPVYQYEVIQQAPSVYQVQQGPVQCAPAYAPCAPQAAIVRQRSVYRSY